MRLWNWHETFLARKVYSALSSDRMGSLRARLGPDRLDDVAEPIDEREGDLPRWARAELRRLREKIERLEGQHRSAALARAEQLTPQRRLAISRQGVAAARQAKASCTHESTFERNGVTYCVSCRRRLS